MVSLSKLASARAVVPRAALEPFNMPRTRRKTKKPILIPDGDAAEDVESHEGDGNTAFSYDRGPAGAILVTSEDVASLAQGEMLRDGVVDALARHMWQDGLSAGAAANTFVFCSVFFRRLFNEGPAAVAVMTKRREVFSASRWMFVVCHQDHWILVVIDGVADLQGRLSATRRGGRAPLVSQAKLAILNSAPGAGTVNVVVSVLLKWVAAAAIGKGLRASMGEAVARRWVQASLTQASPPVPRQSPGTNDCGVFMLSFFPCASLWTPMRDISPIHRVHVYKKHPTLG